MNTKLTLTIEDHIIERAKRYAKSRGRSLSDIIQTYLEALTNDQVDSPKGKTPIVKALRGSFKQKDSRNYKELLTEALEDKYLKQ